MAPGSLFAVPDDLDASFDGDGIARTNFFSSNYGFALRRLFAIAGGRGISRSGLACLLYLLTCISGCTPPPPETTLNAQAGSPPGAHQEASQESVLARVAGQAVTAAEFKEFLDRSRCPGCRPATLTEAARLLNRLLERKLLDAEVARRGLPMSDESHSEVLSELVDRVASPATVSAGELKADQSRRGELTGAYPPEATRRRLLAQKQRVQESAVLAKALAEARPEIDSDLLKQFIRPATSSADAPPVPPRFAEAIGVRQAIGPGGEAELP